jgi:hypothetical protein
MLDRDQDEMCAWLKEQFEAVEEEGALAALVLFHYSAANMDISEIDGIRSNQTNLGWGDGEKLSARFCSVSTRHARGIAGGGQQQFQIHAVYGTSQKPKRVYPFLKMGQINFMATTAASGMSTDPPTQIGMSQQAMRWGERIVDRTFGYGEKLMDSQQRALDKRDETIKELTQENRDLFLALRQVLIDTVKLEHDKRINELQFLRSSNERAKLIRLLPALANGIAGRQIFPENAEDSALVRELAEVSDPETVEKLRTILAVKSPEAAALLMNRFEEKQKERKQDVENFEKLVTEVRGDGTYEEGELEASGLAGQLRKIITPSEKRVNGNGHAAPRQLQAAAPEVVEQPPNEDTQLMEELFSEVSGMQRAMLFGALAGKNKALADRLKARAAKVGSKEE